MGKTVPAVKAIIALRVLVRPGRSASAQRLLPLVPTADDATCAGHRIEGASHRGPVDGRPCELAAAGSAALGTTARTIARVRWAPVVRQEGLPVKVRRPPRLHQQPVRQRWPGAIALRRQRQAQQVEDSGNNGHARKRNASRHAERQAHLGGDLQHVGAVGVQVARQQRHVSRPQAVVHEALLQPAQRLAHLARAVWRLQQLDARAVRRRSAPTIPQRGLEGGEGSLPRVERRRERLCTDAQHPLHVLLRATKAPPDERRRGHHVSREHHHHFGDARGEHLHEVQLGGGEAVKTVEGQQQPIAQDAVRGAPDGVARHRDEGEPVGSAQSAGPLPVGTVDAAELRKPRLRPLQGALEALGGDGGRCQLLDEAPQELDKAGARGQPAVVGEVRPLHGPAQEPMLHHLVQLGV
jgi:hypothetical protein